MRKTYKYRLFPTKAQKTILNQILEECRWVYNKTLEYRKSKYEQEKISISKYDTNNLLPGWKKERETLKIPYSQHLVEVQERVDLAFRHFFRRVKNGEDPGYPRFKGQFRYDSFTYSQIVSNIKFIEENKIRLPKIGIIKFKKHRSVEGKIKRITLKRSTTNKWYIYFSVEIDKEVEKIKGNNTVGIDLGIKTFATLSDGTTIENPRFLKQEEKELTKAHRKLSKAKKGSPERSKRRKVLYRVYERINNKKNNFQHQWSRRLINNYGIICLEKLDIIKMQKTGFKPTNKAMKDVAWNAFVNKVLYKAEEAGRVVVLINPRYTSRICSKCGSIKDRLNLKERVYNCEKCNLEMDRDLNASVNILRLGLQSLPVKAGSPTR